MWSCHLEIELAPYRAFCNLCNNTFNDNMQLQSVYSTLDFDGALTCYSLVDGDCGCI